MLRLLLLIIAGVRLASEGFLMNKN